MIKILSVVGARPNFMKVAPIHRAFCKAQDRFEHSIVHTGQHYDAVMSDAFFADLEMPAPSFFLGVGSGTHAEQSAKVMVGFENVVNIYQPDYVIVVGDVNSTIACALTSVKMGIQTGHVEAGLRSGDRTMPEEINRLATDAIVDDLFVTEQSGIDNLKSEGVSADRIHMVGNTMIDSLLWALPKSKSSTIHQRCDIVPGNYVVATLHRPSNVDDTQQLRMLVGALAKIATHAPVVFPVHPRTKKHIVESEIIIPDGVIMIDPVGYVDFLALLKDARCVLTDSGGIQEETTALGVPCVTARTTTERPITITLGTNMLVAPQHDLIVLAVLSIINGNIPSGSVPPMWDGLAAERIVSTLDKRYA